MKRPLSRNSFKETGVIRKRWKNRITVGLVFPDTYGTGMSNLGFQRVYELLNAHDLIVAERFFLPAFGQSDVSIRSVESSRGLGEFDLILFSISFEYSYLNIPLILAGGRIPVFTEDRKTSCPLVLAGGIACQINPEPAAPFIDAFLLGDFEAICPDFVEFLEDHELSGKKGRLLESLSLQVPGVYVPSFYMPLSGRISQEGPYGQVLPAIQEKPPQILPHTVVLSEKASFPDTFLMEVGRGCGRGCRFCAAGYVYRPPRPWPAENIKNTLALAEETKKIGLVGLEFMETAGLHELISSLLQSRFKLGFSSLRADAVTRDFASLLAASGSKTATIAPEAGSETLRRRINKNLTREQILECCRQLVTAGIRNLKLYFMIGLPFEDDEDVEDIVCLSKEILQMFTGAGRKRGNLGHLTVSVSTFVPKAWTPFQWAAFAGKNHLGRRRDILEKGLRGVPNVRLRLDSPEKAFIQAILSRGDRDLAQDLIIQRLKGMGTRKLVKKISSKAEKYLRERSFDEPFPWEILNHRVKKAFLYSQWQKAQQGRQSPFCELLKCRRCGACK